MYETESEGCSSESKSSQSASVSEGRRRCLFGRVFSWSGCSTKIGDEPAPLAEARLLVSELGCGAVSIVTLKFLVALLEQRMSAIYLETDRDRQRDESMDALADYDNRGGRGGQLTTLAMAVRLGALTGCGQTSEHLR